MQSKLGRAIGATVRLEWGEAAADGAGERAHSDQPTKFLAN